MKKLSFFVLVFGLLANLFTNDDLLSLATNGAAKSNDIGQKIK